MAARVPCPWSFRWHSGAGQLLLPLVLLAQLDQTCPTQGCRNDYGWHSQWHVSVSSSVEASVPSAKHALGLNVSLEHRQGAGAFC